MRAARVPRGRGLIGRSSAQVRHGSSPLSHRGLVRCSGTASDQSRWTCADAKTERREAGVGVRDRCRIGAQVPRLASLAPARPRSCGSAAPARPPAASSAPTPAWSSFRTHRRDSVAGGGDHRRAGCGAGFAGGRLRPLFIAGAARGVLVQATTVGDRRGTGNGACNGVVSGGVHLSGGRLAVVGQFLRQSSAAAPRWLCLRPSPGAPQPPQVSTAVARWDASAC